VSLNDGDLEQQIILEAAYVRSEHEAPGAHLQSIFRCLQALPSVACLAF
jgi:hypothetical protein